MQNISARDNPLVQAISAAICSRATGRSAALVAGERYGFGSLSTRALVASVGSSGGFLVPSELYAAEVIDALRAIAVVRKHVPAANFIPMPRGNISFGRANSIPAAGWIGEDVVTEIATAPVFGDVALQAKKAIAVLPVSKYSEPGVEAVIRDKLLKQYASIEDQAFLTGIGSQFSPKGVRWSAKTVNTATLSYNVSTVISDLKGLAAALETANVPMRNPVWFASTKIRDYLATAVDSVGAFQFPSVSEGRLLGWPIAATTNIPVNLGGSSNQSEIYLVDMDSFLIGTAYIDVSLSSGTYHDNSGNLLSAFDRDESIIRLIVGIDCALQHSEAAAVLTAVPWGN